MEVVEHVITGRLYSPSSAPRGSRDWSGAQEAAITTTIAAYREVARRIAHARPDTVIFISPHTAYFKDWIFVASGEGVSGDFSLYGRFRSWILFEFRS